MCPMQDLPERTAFTYRANDGTVSSTAATVTINVAPTNTPPTAVDDTYQVNADAVLNVIAANGLLANDRDNQVA